MDDVKTEVVEPEVVEAEVVSDTTPMISGEDPILAPDAFHFAKLISEGTNSTEAYRLSHPWSTAKPKSMAEMAYQLSKNPKVREQISILQEAVRLQIIAEAPAAFVRLKEIAENAKGEKVRLEANLEILDRAGLKPPSRVETLTVGLWGSLSTQDVRDMVKRRVENQT